MKKLFIGWAGLFTTQLTIGLVVAPFIGAFVLHYVLMFMLGSSSDDIFGLYLLSIICTLGIGLVVWIPLWYVTGYAVIIVVNLLLGVFGYSLGSLISRRIRKTPHNQSLSRDQLALTNYIQKARQKGLDDAQILSNLKQNGWNSQSVTAVFQLIENET